MEIPAKGSIIAINGENGNVLWEFDTGQEMFSSAQFEDLDGDGELDVILGGRGHQLKAIDGQSGDLIWSFDSNNSLIFIVVLLLYQLIFLSSSENFSGANISHAGNFSFKPLAIFMPFFVIAMIAILSIS